MQRFQYSVQTKASPRLAWDIFSNIRRWHTFSNVYGELRWREGEPWQPGSRLRIEILQPIRAMVDHVITHCVPAQKVGWIDHGLGITMEQWVEFQALPSGDTQVSTYGELVGSTTTIEGHAVAEVIAEFMSTWYENFRLVCDQLAASES